MANSKSTPIIKLDWSRLLGFDQATRVTDQPGSLRLTAPTVAKLGGKVGSKVGGKPGFSRRR